MKKAMMKPGVFDEAAYYKSEKVQMGGADDTDDYIDEDEDGEELDEEE